MCFRKMGFHFDTLGAGRFNFNGSAAGSESSIFVQTALTNRSSSSIIHWFSLEWEANGLIQDMILCSWIKPCSSVVHWHSLMDSYCCFDLQIDPDLSWTVVVSTKLDTRIPQFACRADVELFLRPSQRLLEGNILSRSLFFTSVHSGRVGVTRDSVHRSNDHFREVISYVDILMMSITSHHGNFSSEVSIFLTVFF